MANETDTLLSGELLEDDATLTLVQLCHVCQVSTENVRCLVAEGIIEPLGVDAEQWRFQVVSARRVRRAVRLERDLGVNIAGVALALDLLDQLDAAQERLNRLYSDGTSRFRSPN